MTGTREICFFVCLYGQWRLGAGAGVCLPRSTSVVFLYSSQPPALFFESRSLTDLELAVSVNWLASKPSGLASLCPSLSSTGVTIICCMFSFDVNARGPSLSHHVCTASTLPSEPSPQPWDCLFVCFVHQRACFSKPAVQTPTLWALLTCKSPQTNTRNLGMGSAAIANPQNGKREFFKSYIW